MTTSQLAAIAYTLGVIDNVRSHLYQLTADLDDIEEGVLSVKLETALKSFDERAAEYRKTLNEYADEITIDPIRSREGRQAATR
jgi:uncharacterized protein YhaN